MGAARRYLPSDPVDFARSRGAHSGCWCWRRRCRRCAPVVLVGAGRRRGDRDRARRARSLGVGRRGAGGPEPALGRASPAPARRPRRLGLRRTRLARCDVARRSRRSSSSAPSPDWPLILRATPGVAVAALAGPPLGALGRRRVPRVGAGRAARRAVSSLGRSSATSATSWWRRRSCPRSCSRSRTGSWRRSSTAARCWAGRPGSWALGPAVVGQADRVRRGALGRGRHRACSCPLMLALGVGGLLAGVIAVRTRSLLIPIAVHIGLDIPIYFAFACGT